MPFIRLLESECISNHLFNTLTFLGRHKYAILILAAGKSERLGMPKQLVKWNQSTLLNHTIAQAIRVCNSDVFVALGANQKDIRPSISSEAIILDITNWQDGMGTTISSSLSQIDVGNYKGIILSVCDQPYISNDIFDNLMNAFENENSSIIVSQYKNGSGPPTLFAKKHYYNLLQIRGDIGAKKIIRENLNEVTFISFENGDIDIDTEEDLKNLSINESPPKTS